MPDRPHFDFDAFYNALSATVSARNTNWKTVSQQTGVSQSTLSRMSKGRQPDAASLTALAAWSGINPVEFTTAPTRRRESIATVSRLLRQDPRLDAAGADALEAIIKTAYENLKRKPPPD
ncbi:MAG: hypothetical protein OXQ29_27440 [Rhodospirillaceae bacterium]|nr:hypothetical protein [Rhodospirillaceae bacterium]